MTDYPFPLDPAPQEQVIIEGKVWEWHQSDPVGNIGWWDVSNVITVTDVGLNAGAVLKLDAEVISAPPGGGPNPPVDITNYTYAFDMNKIQENV